MKRTHQYLSELSNTSRHKTYRRSNTERPSVEHNGQYRFDVLPSHVKYCHGGHGAGAIPYHAPCCTSVRIYFNLQNLFQVSLIGDASVELATVNLLYISQLCLTLHICV